MTKEELLKFIGNLGPISRIIKIKGIGGKISEEGGIYISTFEEESLDSNGYKKVVAEKINVCDCGHVGEVAGRCSNPSCRKTLCRDCCKTCELCGNVYCRECLTTLPGNSDIYLCTSCRKKLLMRTILRKLLGFEK